MSAAADEIERLRAVVADERQRFAAIADTYISKDRFTVHAEWSKMTPSEIYNAGATDAAAWIKQEILAQE